MHLQLEQYELSIFNSLPPIELADADMRNRKRLELAFARLGPVFAEHGMCDSWGIGLLHKHWHLEDGEVPIQHVEDHGDHREFTTLPRAGSFLKPVFASVLAVKDLLNPVLQALEFTTDLAVQRANLLLAQNPQFAHDFCRSIFANGLEDTFGLVAIRTATSPDLQLVEFNYEGRISVVRETIASAIEGRKLIQTSWRLAVD